MFGSLGASSSIFQACCLRSLSLVRRSHWMRLKRRPTSASTALAGNASSSLPALPPRFTTAMRAAIFFCSSAGSSFDTRSAASVAVAIVRIEQPVDARAMNVRR